MSIFRVNLNQNDSAVVGSVSDPAVYNSYSIQRSVWLEGPDRIKREVKDGTTFSDSNYYKRYTTSGGSAQSDAILTLVSDDGSIWSDYNSSLNTTPFAQTFALAGASTYSTAGNSIDFVGTYNSYCVFLEVINLTNATCKMRLNGSSTAILTVPANGTLVYDVGDLSVSSIAFDNSASGASTVNLEILTSLQTISTT